MATRYRYRYSYVSDSDSDSDFDSENGGSDDDDNDNNNVTLNPIVSKDPSNPIDFEVNRPSLIRDILRTKYCVSGSIFLVEGIEVSVWVDDDDDGDGDDEEKDEKIVSGTGGERRRSEEDGKDLRGKENCEGSEQQRIEEEERKRRHKRRSRRRRAVRVLLGDGELCIQALLKAEAHWLVDRDVVWEGCYVRADQMELGFIEPGENGGDREAYLLVSEKEAY